MRSVLFAFSSSEPLPLARHVAPTGSVVSVNSRSVVAPVFGQFTAIGAPSAAFVLKVKPMKSVSERNFTICNLLQRTAQREVLRVHINLNASCDIAKPQEFD